MDTNDYEILNKCETAPKFSFDGQRKQVKCTSVYDGDTLSLMMVLNGHPYVFSCRMYGYNSAEIRGGNEESKALAQKAKHRLIELTKDKILVANCGKFDKYGRILVTLFTHDNININELMLKENHGKPYFGKGEKEY